MSDLNQCLTFISCQLQPPHGAQTASDDKNRWHAVTISRQTGSGGHAVAEKLADYLQAHAPGHSPWMVFDRNLVEKVLEDHHLPGRLARFMTEDRKSQMEDTLDELFGLHPPTWTLVHKTSATILQLAELGNVVLMGRGSNIITSRLPNVFHVRLVGSLENRVGHLAAIQGIEKKAALDLIRQEDLGRRRYLKKYFDRDIDDPLLYHLVINTTLTGHESAAKIIGDAMLSHDQTTVRATNAGFLTTSMAHS